MNDRQRIQLAAATGDRSNLLAQVLDVVSRDGTTVMGRMRDAQGGLRARQYDATQSGNRRRDTTFAGMGEDRALADERELDQCIEAAARAVNRAWAIAASYPPAHVATAGERRSLGLGDGPYCESCARTNRGDGSPRQEPIRPDLIGATDVGGRLGEKMLLCSWCYSCVCDWGRVPAPAEVERHHTHGRVPWPDDVPRPA
jgi:hypothetical protein